MLLSRLAVLGGLFGFASLAPVLQGQGPTVTVTEFLTCNFSSGPSSIVAGPDGALWYTESACDNIGRITTDGNITLFPVLTQNSYPAGIAAGSDGALWFTEANANNIGRITVNGSVTEYPIPTANAQAYEIAAGPDGALWFLESAYGNNKIGRITTDGSISEFNIPTPSGSTYNLTAGPDGAIWFTEYIGNKIGRITTTGAVTEFSISTPDDDPTGIAIGPDGALWFAEGNGYHIGRITTDGVISEYGVPQLGIGTFLDDITGGSDGALWYTNMAFTKVERTTTTGVVSQYSIPTPNSNPQGITAGPDGSIWFVEYSGGRIARVTIGSPSLEVSSPIMTFLWQQGAPDPPSQSLTIYASGDTVAFTSAGTTPTGNWLSASGSGTTGTPTATLPISVSPQGLPVGAYLGQITITAVGEPNSPITIPVVLNVISSSPWLASSLSPIAFSWQQGATGAPPSQNLTVYSSTGTALSFTASTTTTPAGGTWLSTSPSAGTTGNPSAILVVSVSPQGLVAGTYQGQITITAPGSGGPLNIPVTFTITPPPPSIVVSPTELQFTYQQGATAPLTLPLNGTASYGTLSFTAAASTTPSGGTWLSVSPSGGTLGTAPTTLNVTVAGGLSQGTYTGQITITASGAINSPLPAPVTLTVTAPTQPLSLAFPIHRTCRGTPCTPYSAPMAAIFDHLMTSPYSKGNSLQAYTTDLGNRSDGPGTLTATPANGQVALSWTPTVPQTGTTTYKLSYATGKTFLSQGNYCSKHTIFSGTGTSFTHGGLTDGTTYN